EAFRENAEPHPGVGRRRPAEATRAWSGGQGAPEAEDGEDDRRREHLVRVALAGIPEEEAGRGEDHGRDRAGPCSEEVRSETSRQEEPAERCQGGGKPRRRLVHLPAPESAEAGGHPEVERRLVRVGLAEEVGDQEGPPRSISRAARAYLASSGWRRISTPRAGR